MAYRKRRVLAVVIALAASSVLVASPASAARGGGGPKKPPAVGVPNGTFSCRAALARLEGAGLLAGLDAELFTANPAQDPCQTDFAGILAALNVSGTLIDRKLTTTSLLSVRLKVLYGGTQLLKDAGYSLPREAVAEAGVALLQLAVLGNDIEVAVLTSNAKARCNGDQPSLGGRSQVVGLKINGVLSDGDAGIKISLGQHIDLTIHATLLARLELQALYSLTAELTALLDAGMTLHLNHQIRSSGPGYEQVTQRALWLETGLLGDVIISESIADVHGNPCTTTTGPPPPPPPPSAAKGWMTGGGRISSSAGNVTHGFRLECTPGSGPNNLQVSWPGGGFHLTEVKAHPATVCDNGADGVNSSGNPAAGFDTLRGAALGRCNGGDAVAEYTLTDKGEPGTADTFTIRITGSCTLTASGTLTRGNHQAHGRP